MADDAPTASSAKPEQLSKRQQRSSMRLADFQRRMELQRAQTAAKLLQLWSVVWLQRLVRRRMAERYVSVPRPRTYDDRTGRVFPDHLITPKKRRRIAGEHCHTSNHTL